MDELLPSFDHEPTAFPAQPAMATARARAQPRPPTVDHSRLRPNLARDSTAVDAATKPSFYVAKLYSYTLPTPAKRFPLFPPPLAHSPAHSSIASPAPFALSFASALRSFSVGTNPCASMRCSRLISSTLSAASIAARTRAFSSFVRSRPALPVVAAASTVGAWPGSNVRAPGAREGTAAPAERERARGVGSPVGRRKSALAAARSCEWE